MKFKSFGFTVVEILLVISVLGILVTVGTVGWSGITKSSANNVRGDEVNQWITSFNLYKSRFGAWPALPVDDSTPKLLCLGRFSTNNNKCGQFASGAPSKYIDATSSDTTNMLTEITKVGKEPTDSAPAINKSLIGPFAYLTQSTTAGATTVTGKFIGIFDGNTCPSGFINDSTNAPSVTLMAGVPSGTAIACASTKAITYNPNGDQVAVLTPTPSPSPSLGPIIGNSPQTQTQPSSNGQAQSSGTGNSLSCPVAYTSPSGGLGCTPFQQPPPQQQQCVNSSNIITWFISAAVCTVVAVVAVGIAIAVGVVAIGIGLVGGAIGAISSGIGGLTGQPSSSTGGVGGSGPSGQQYSPGTGGTGASGLSGQQYSPGAGGTGASGSNGTGGIGGLGY